MAGDNDLAVRSRFSPGASVEVVLWAVRDQPPAGYWLGPSSREWPPAAAHRSPGV